MWSEALDHIVGAWTEEEYQADGKYWQMGAPRRVQPKPLQQPHPPIFGATSSPDGHREIGRQGIGLCSFTVGLPPEELAEQHRRCTARAWPSARSRSGKFVNDTAATFTMVHCAPTKEEAYEVAEESFVWYPKHGARLIASVAEWLEEQKQELGTYQYTGDTLERDQRDGVARPPHVRLPPRRAGSAVVGDPDECIETASATRRRAATCCSAS